MKIGNEKRKIVKNIIVYILLFCIILYCFTHFCIPFSTVFKVDDVYVQLRLRLGRPVVIALGVSADKNLNFCTVVPGLYMKEKFINTHRTYEELKNECVYVELYDIKRQDIFRIKDILKDKIIVY